MVDYVEELKNKYVQGLVEKFEEWDREEKYQLRALQALFQLANASGNPQQWIQKSAIRKTAGISGSTVGVWGSLEAGIVEKQKVGRVVSYRIRPEFYDAIQRALRGGGSTTPAKGAPKSP